MMTKKCRFCANELKHSFVDLGMSPLSNSYIKASNLQNKENFYPLHTYVCSNCFLAQLEEFESPKEIFSDYAYFSSYSKIWLEHVEQYTKMVIERFDLNKSSQIVEVASNDGYLLQYFKQQGFNVLGIEPAQNVAEVSRNKGIDTVSRFFDIKLAEELQKNNKLADLLIGNNVLAHVPNINNFVQGMKIALKPYGVITMEFPHLLRLIEQNQFDTIYHEHFSYISFITVKRIFERHDLQIFDVEELKTHGGSLRIYAKHKENEELKVSKSVDSLLNKEILYGLNNIDTYNKFSKNVMKTKRNILKCLIQLKDSGSTIVGYGAPAKGNTLLNYCGIGNDFLDYTVDINPHKQGLYLPGTHIPIYHPEKIKETKPDYVVILPWNLKEEITSQLSFIREWNGKFIVLIPDVEVF
ncbi:class I SAM-dependent methyltransferase [Clostridium sp. JS66]|uniref:class I SAM-dependent methyltransferase n=1 Tax=Clostridium sp. JS66 TaxID=3064705 RepID=UPI00298E4927|nr:class I SAM-dependent methyltransferase [Clostridium sp. JS66]WPC41058.1 class I SAM-dependent methyltransferase [Clostridium sp. JS66]